MLLKMVEPVTKNMENLSNYIIGNVYRVAVLLILQLNVELFLPTFNICISGLIRYNKSAGTLQSLSEGQCLHSKHGVSKAIFSSEATL